MQKQAVDDLVRMQRQLRLEEDCCQLEAPAFVSHAQRMSMIRNKSKRPFQMPYEEIIDKLSRDGKLLESLAKLRKEMEKGDFKCI